MITIFLIYNLQPKHYCMEINNAQLKGLSKEQKTGFVLLLVFGFLTVGLGFLQMRNTIYNPFIVRVQNNSSDSNSMYDMVLLQQTDTDNDGISDYDEMEYYKTSAYLPDSDSDGVDDKMEIELGTDPLCAEGEICEVELAPAEGAELESPLSTDSGIQDILNAVGQSATSTGSLGQSGIDINAIMNSPDMIRQLLLSTGQITEEQLSQIDDATLMEMIKEINLNSSETQTQ